MGTGPAGSVFGENSFYREIRATRLEYRTPYSRGSSVEVGLLCRVKVLDRVGGMLYSRGYSLDYGVLCRVGVFCRVLPREEGTP